MPVAAGGAAEKRVRGLGRLERGEVGVAALDETFVVLGMRDEGRGCPGVHERDEAFVQVGRVTEDGEIGTQGLVVGVVEARIGRRTGDDAEPGGEMAARGEAHDTDALPVDVPLGRPVTDEADRPLDILESSVAVVRHPILEHDAGDAEAIEPGRDFGAFLVVG
jgi:hypothetical protein